MDLTQLKTESPLVFGFAESRIGGRSENQDSLGYADTPLGFLITVCDGMGGGPGGKTASSIAVKEIINGVIEADRQEKVSNILIKAIRRANMAIISHGNEQTTLQGMGSTCTVMLINSISATIAHVGDSRIYQFRGSSKIFRTFDHSMVFDLVKQKVITEEQARLSVQSNIITRALGIKPDLEVEVTERSYETGDRFLLCSDGIHGSVEEKVLIKLITNKKINLGPIVDGIATEIDNIGRTSGGGHDNLTLAIVETKSNSILKEKMSKKIKQILLAIGTTCIISIVINMFLAVTSFEQANKLHNPEILKGDSLIKANRLLAIQIEEAGKEIKSLNQFKQAFDSLLKIPENKSFREQLKKALKQ